MADWHEKIIKTRLEILLEYKTEHVQTERSNENLHLGFQLKVGVFQSLK